MKKRKQIPNCDADNYKSNSVTMSSLSDSYSNCSSMPNWKRGISENGNVFFVKYTQRSGYGNCSQIKYGKTMMEPRKMFKLSSVKDENIKELFLIVSSVDRYRYGRRSSIIESLLGFEVVPFHDNTECLMVGNIIDNNIKMEHPYINEGDWFKTMENIEVRTGNIDMLLLQYTKATRVKLTFKGPCKHSVKEDVIREITSFEDFASVCKNAFHSELQQERLIFLTLIVSREYFKADANDCIFYYPYVSNNFLYKAKGSFLTMDSVINNDFKSRPILSTIVVDGTKYYIIYGYVNCTFVVCAFSSCYQSRKAALSNGNDFINFLKLNISQHRAIHRSNLTHVCDILKINVENNIGNSYHNLHIRTCLSSSHCISLPKEAQLRICDALSELESMDCRKWSESDGTIHDVIICGSALFYKDYLMSSSLPVGLRKSVECFLRLRGIAEFLSIQDVKEMYIWEKIELLDAKSEHFLAICIRNYLLLVVVLKSVLPVKANILHSLTYMEEITDTINYLISCGIEPISELWLDSSKRPCINSSKMGSQVLQKFNLAHQKNIPSDNNDFPPQSLFQSVELHKQKYEPESAVDWQGSCNKNQLREFDQKYNKNEPLLNEIKSIRPLKLTAGWSNDLKCFLHLNLIDALILQPFKPMCTDLQSCILKDYVLKIHDVLQIHIKKSQDNGLSLKKCQFVVKEHAIVLDLLNTSGEKESFILIGRLFSFPFKEVYICFGQNISQSIIELSFRMSSLSVG